MTDPTVAVALISVGGVGFSAVVGWATAKATGRSALKSEQLKVEAAAHEAWGDLIGQLRREVADQDSKSKSLRERVELLEAGRIEDHAVIRRFAAYARELIGLLRGAGINPPTPPRGFDISE